MQLFYCPGIIKRDFFLSEEESRHCAKVLRRKAGDMIRITDGRGGFYNAELSEVSPKKCGFNITKSTVSKKEDYRIHIALAPTKNIDRTEWFVEKAVEIGIDEISFLISAHSERNTINLNRIQKKSISAMKQSIRPFLTTVNDLRRFSDFASTAKASQKFIAHLDEKDTPYLSELAQPSGDYLVAIGPEGGFSPEEVDVGHKAGFKSVRLGNHRLRTETAGVAATTILNILNLR